MALRDSLQLRWPDMLLESHFQVNHLAQFHLVRILLPVLQRTTGSRLVLMSSDLHRACPSSTAFGSIEQINTDLGAMKLYSRSKLAQVLFVRAIVRRMENNEPGFQSNKQMGPWVNATHPGGVSTDQQDQAVEAYGKLGKVGVAAVRPLLKDPVDEGCRSALFAATSDDVPRDKIQGQYVSRARSSGFNPDLLVTNTVYRSFLTEKSPNHRSKHKMLL